MQKLEPSAVHSGAPDLLLLPPPPAQPASNSVSCALLFRWVRVCAAPRSFSPLFFPRLSTTLPPPTRSQVARPLADYLAAYGQDPESVFVWTSLLCSAGGVQAAAAGDGADAEPPSNAKGDGAGLEGGAQYLAPQGYELSSEDAAAVAELEAAEIALAASFPKCAVLLLPDPHCHLLAAHAVRRALWARLEVRPNPRISFAGSAAALPRLVLLAARPLGRKDDAQALVHHPMKRSSVHLNKQLHTLVHTHTHTHARTHAHTHTHTHTHSFKPLTLQTTAAVLFVLLV
jgi:hypothetical protein